MLRSLKACATGALWGMRDLEVVEMREKLAVSSSEPEDLNLFMSFKVMDAVVC